MKTQAERDYYNYVRQQLKLDKQLAGKEIPAGYTVEERRDKDSNGQKVYTAVVKGNLKSDEKVLDTLTEIADIHGGTLKKNSNTAAGFDFGKNQKGARSFQTAMKFLIDKSQNASRSNEQSGFLNANDDARFTWIKENKFEYYDGLSVDENIQRAEKLEQEYLDKFGITANINTPERTALRRQIIEELYGNGANKKERKAFLIMGLPASGKSIVAETVAQENGALIIDSDMVNEKLPEFSGGILANAVHDESTNIANRILDSALLNEDNVVLPIVGSYENDVREKIQRLKSEGYEVNLYHVGLPIEKTLERAKNRFKETGRLFSTAYIKSVGSKPK